jgi:hypothetical protein
MRPSPAPNILYEQLTRPDPNSQFLEQRIDALDILAIGGSEVQDVRLTYEDLDGDGIPEALFTIQLEGDALRLVALKRKGNQWYRLALPEGFSCWCKYEDSPFDTFAQIRGWPGGKNEPAKLLFVRGSGGGTGLYERALDVYVLRGFEMKKAFNVTEERRECAPDSSKCDLYHVEVTPADEPSEPAALVAARYERHLTGGDFYNDIWWIGLPPQQCKSYTWSAQREEFLENPAATAAYCNHLGERSSSGANR